MSNVYRDPRTGKLDRQFLRTCAVWRLVRASRIATKARAVELLDAAGVRHARQTVELWLTNSALRSAALSKAGV